MRHAKISVIVPIYKAEPYLRKCLDSIAGQTYKTLEIILVDDGSPDGCGAICDEYAARDGRIKVIHQENSGVAAARNAGLGAVTGDYIGWVDSDDWVEPRMFEVMLDCASKQAADIVICGRQERFSDQSFTKGWTQQRELNREQALALLTEDDLVRSYLCDKLWRKELFDGVRFPGLRVYEDMAVMYSLFMKANRVICLPDIFYHYEHHEASLTENPPLTSRMDFYNVVKQRYEDMEHRFPRVAERLETILVSAAVGVWVRYGSCQKQERDVYDAQIKGMAAFCKEHYKAALKETNLGAAGRLVLRLTPYPRRWAYALAGLVSWLYERKHGRSL